MEFSLAALHKIPSFHLISWCGYFAERHSILRSADNELVIARSVITQMFYFGFCLVFSWGQAYKENITKVFFESPKTTFTYKARTFHQRVNLNFKTSANILDRVLTFQESP